MRHPELDDTAVPSWAFGHQQPYMAVGQPYAPVAPVYQQPPSKAPASAPNGVGSILCMALSAFVAGAAIASVFAYQAPSAVSARELEQRAAMESQRAAQYQDRLLQVRNVACETY